MCRVLKPGGRVAVSDIALKRPLPDDLARDVGAYIGCIGGAIAVAEYEGWLQLLGEEREKLFAAAMDPEERKRLLHDLASADSFKSFLRRYKRSKK